MNDYFVETIEARPITPPNNRNLAARIEAAITEWRAIENILNSYKARRTPMNGSILFVSLSRVFHELIDDVPLRARLLQHFEQELKSEFPSPPGTLFSA
jgi:hypothetical protein